MTDREHGVADLAGAVRPWRHRLGLRGTLKWSMRGLGGGLGLAVALLVAARFVPWPDVFMWCAIATAVGTVAGVLYGLLSTPSLEAASRQADRLLGLSDRLGTAWELRCVSSPFAELQRRDALVSTRNRDPGETVRIWPGGSHFLPVVVGLALIGLLVALPNPLDLVIQQQEQLQRQLAQAREEVQKTKEEATASDSSLSAEERAVVEEALERLEDALSQVEDTPEALAAISRAEMEIGALREPKIDRVTELQDVGATLAASPTTQGLEQALNSMDETALRDAMYALANRTDSMSDVELEELAAVLQRAANVATGNEAVAGLLRQASRATASGDQETIGVALGDLADSLALLQQEVEATQALDRTLADLRGSRSSISGVVQAQAGRGPATEGVGLGGSGPGSVPGQSGQGTDGGAQGGGIGRQGSGGSGIGSGGGMGGSGAGSQPGDRVGAGTGRLSTDGETVFVPGRGPDIPAEVRAGTGAGVEPGLLRPYREVLGEYAEQAREHMERSPVPQGYKDLVRRYFAELDR